MGLVELRVFPILPEPRDYPKNLIAKIDSAIYQALVYKVRPLIKNALYKRSANWQIKITFGSIYRRPKTDEFVLYVFPTGSDKVKSIWKYVSRGTDPHPITAVRAPMLKYPTDYTPKTKPGNVYGRKSGYSGPWRTAVAVEHPGIEAREFEEHVIEETEKQIVKQIQLAINKALG
jgi:hypothetical protein